MTIFDPRWIHTVLCQDAHNGHTNTNVPNPLHNYTSRGIKWIYFLSMAVKLDFPDKMQWTFNNEYSTLDYVSTQRVFACGR